MEIDTYYHMTIKPLKFKKGWKIWGQKTHSIWLKRKLKTPPKFMFRKDGIIVTKNSRIYFTYAG